MKKLLILASIAVLFSCGSSSDTMTEEEALFAFNSVSAIIAGSSECISGSFEYTATDATFDNCVVVDPLCESLDMITINGSINASNSGSLTFSGIVNKTCNINSDNVLCGVNLSGLTIGNVSNFCETLGLD